MRLVVAFGLLVSVTVLAGVSRPAPAQDTEDLFERVKRIAAEAKESSRKARDKERERRKRTGERGAWGASDDGALLAAGTPTGDVELWKVGDKKPFRILAGGHGGLVDSIDIAESANELWARADDGTVRVWNLEDGELTNTLGEADTEYGYLDVAVSPDDRYVALIRLGVEVWDRTKGYLDNTPGITSYGVTFLDDSKRLVVQNTDGVALHDLTAEPRKSDDGDEFAAEAVWELRKKKLTGFGRNREAALGDSTFTMTEVNEKHDLVIALSDPSLMSREKKPKWTLRAFDLETGEKRWERQLAASMPRLKRARDADFAVMLDASKLHFISLETGKTTKSFSVPKVRNVGILAPDASAWYDADRGGTLIRIELIRKPKPAKPAKPSADPK